MEDAAPVIIDNSTTLTMELVFLGVELVKNGTLQQEDAFANLDSLTSRVDVETAIRINITIPHY